MRPDGQPARRPGGQEGGHEAFMQSVASPSLCMQTLDCVLVTLDGTYAKDRKTRRQGRGLGECVLAHGWYRLASCRIVAQSLGSYALRPGVQGPTIKEGQDWTRLKCNRISKMDLQMRGR